MNKYILSHYGLLQYIEYSSRCCTVGCFCLPILYIVVCICFSQFLNLSLPHPLPLLVTLSLFSRSVSLRLLFLAVLGLCCCVRAFSSFGDWAPLSRCGARGSRGSSFSLRSTASSRHIELYSRYCKWRCFIQ